MKAMEVTAGLAESNGSLTPGLRHDSLHMTCGLVNCTPGSAPGPTLGNEYGKMGKLYFTFFTDVQKGEWLVIVCMPRTNHLASLLAYLHTKHRLQFQSW